MWEFLEGYGIWVILAIVAMYLFSKACGHGGGMSCGGHGGHERDRGERRHRLRESEDERDEETVGATRNGGPHH